MNGEPNFPDGPDHPLRPPRHLSDEWLFCDPFALADSPCAERGPVPALPAGSRRGRGSLPGGIALLLAAAAAAARCGVRPPCSGCILIQIKIADGPLTPLTCTPDNG